MTSQIDAATIAQVRRDLLAAIAETQAEIQRLEAFLAAAKAARETDEEPAAAAEGETQE